MTSGYDYSYWRPGSAGDLAGISFVCRYLSNTPGKNLTLAEAQQLTSWGISVVSNWESSGQGGDFNQGAQDAMNAKSQADAAGMPAGRPIYFSVDADLNPASTDSYRQGILSVLPGSQVGIYGSAAVVQHWRANGVSWGWRTMSTDWQGGSSTSGCQIVQTGGNNNVDFNEAIAADYGQWQVGGASTPPPVIAPPTPIIITPTSKEDEMQIDSPSVHPGEYAFAFTVDPKTVVLVADGYSGPPAAVRLAIWAGDHVAVETISLGGSSNRHTVGHPLPGGTTGVTVSRKDSANYPVGIAFA